MTTTKDQQAFVKEFWTAAKQIEQRHGIPAIATLAQAGLESGWGTSALMRQAFNFWGIKATSRYPGKKLLWKTWEVHKTPAEFYQIYTAPRAVLSTPKRTKKGNYLAQVTDYFRAYDSAEAAFENYAAIIKQTYPKALTHKDPLRFLQSLSNGENGYRWATDDAYLDKLPFAVNVVTEIVRNLPEQKKSQIQT